jgi:hypothetical protein
MGHALDHALIYISAKMALLPLHWPRKHDGKLHANTCGSLNAGTEEEPANDIR